MTKKVSKVKYSLQNIDTICPECHKNTYDKEKWFIPASLEKWGDTYTNVCPHCGYCFDNTTFLGFLQVKKYFPDAPEALCHLLEDIFFCSINCNDYFAVACADDEEFDEALLHFYCVLTTKEEMTPKDALNGLRQWVRGCLEFGKKHPDKVLKQIRKLTGFKWYPGKIRED